jgi:hypothetical protein
MEHFEGHGDHWNALGFSDEEALKIIPESIKEGVLAENNIYEFPETNDKILPIIYPKLNPVQICSLIVSSNGKNTAESFYPLVEGIKNDIVFYEKFTWENNLEGEVEINRDDRMNISFFAPFYKHDFSNTKKGMKEIVYLSALALSVEKPMMEFEVKEGQFYEMQLNEFLKNNPNKTKHDFPPLIMHMDGSIILFPTNDYSVYEYRGKILDLNYIDFFGKKIAKTKVCIEKTDSAETMYVNLYISENNIKNYELKVGNDLQAIIWLMGYK